MNNINLAEVGDINAIVNYLNVYQAGTFAPEYFYTKQLLDMIRTPADQYVYYKLADTSPITGPADKLQLRRWAPLQAHTVPLEEGIPPKSDKSSVETYEIPAFQYGRYMEFTDLVDFKMLDPVIAIYSREYSIVAIETLDRLAREALFAVANPSFAGQASGFESLSPDSKPAIEDLRLIVLDLQRKLVKPRQGSNYLVIISPEIEFDWVTDPTVQQYMRINHNTYSVYSQSQIPDMFGMTFQKTQVVPQSGEFYKKAGNAPAATKHLRIYQVVDPGNGAPVTYNFESLDSANSPYFKKADPGAYTIDSRTGQEASYIPGLESWDLAKYNADHPANAGESEWKELPVQHVLIVGKDALIRTGIGGEGNTKMYVKPKGSAGVLDPIDQRQSIGFKINSVGFGSSRLEAIVDYQCVPTSIS